MQLTRNRSAAVLAATLAALAIGASPALAGENDDEGDDDEDAAVVQPQAGSDSSAGLSAAPQGGVATGAGGTAAPDAPDAVLLGLASGAFLLVAGRGLTVAARRSEA